MMGQIAQLLPFGGRVGADLFRNRPFAVVAVDMDFVSPIFESSFMGPL